MFSELPSQSYPGSAYVQEPSSEVARALKLQADSSVHPEPQAATSNVNAKRGAEYP